MSLNDPSDRPAELDALDPEDDAATLPPDLEARTIGELQTQRLIRAPAVRKRVLAWAAAVALAFAAGFALARAGLPPTVGAGAAAGGGDRFMLLLYEDTAFEAPPPEQAMDRVAEYVGWLEGMRARGIVVSGDELGPRRAMLGAPIEAADTPPGQVSGYFVVEAASFEAAEAVAASCPHLRYGGRVAVRPIIDHG